MSNLPTKPVVVNPQLTSIENSEFYRLLVNSIQDYAIFLLDPEGVVASWNVGAQNLKGFLPHEIIGQHFSKFYGPEDLESRKPWRELEIANQLGHVEDEGWRIKKDGSKFWANVVITALRGPKGNIIGYAKVTRDLTERKKHEDDVRLANEQLNQQRLELEMLNNAKDEFISLASHQLRTPVSGVKQFLGLLLEGYAGDLTEQQRDYLNRAYEGNNRQIDLINDLLKVAQVDAGKIALTIKPVDLKALIQDAVDEQADAFKGRKQNVTLKLPNEAVTVNVDQLRFRMVLENLLSNATKYTHDGGKITISVKVAKKAVEIAVRDSGVGIPANEISRLFSKFSRIQNDLSDKVGGSGLGLYWAQKIVQLHNGEICVVSEPGKGSIFTVSIPATSGE